MYDIYHWEAHPNGSFPKVNNVAERVPHYEAYLEKYPFITLPGMVDDGPDAQKCVVSKLFGASYTTIVTVGMDGKIKYRKDFPGNWSNAYAGLDAMLASLLQASVSVAAGSMERPAPVLNAPEPRGFSFDVFDLTGRRLGFGEYGAGVPASGAYIERITGCNGTYTAKALIVKRRPFLKTQIFSFRH